MKKRIIILIVSIFVLLSDNMYVITYSMEEYKTYLVYDKLSYNKGDIVTISFDMPYYYNLFEMIVRIDYDPIYLKVLNSDNPFEQDSHSVFSSYILNESYNNHIVYAEAVNKELEGSFSNYKNNLCKLSFIAVCDITNILDILNKESIKLYLFDNNHVMISYTLLYHGRIKGEFISNNIDVCIYEGIDDLSKIFKVNQDKDKYELFIDNMVDFDSIGRKVLMIGLYDIVTGDYSTVSTIINVVDNKPPIITGDNNYVINDSDIYDNCFSREIIISKLEVTDNYSSNIEYDMKYFNTNNEIINNDEALNYLIKDSTINASVLATDEYGNVSEEFVITISINDVTPPSIITQNSIIELYDYEANSIDFSKYYTVSDLIDNNPSITFELYDKKNNPIPIHQLLDYFTVNNDVILSIIAKDSSNNISNKEYITFCLIDTTSIVVTSPNDITINDFELHSLEVKSLISYTDNDTRDAFINYSIIVDGNSYMNINEAYDNILSNKNFNIEYTLTDYSNNKTYFNLTVSVIDTTSPTISLNVSNDKVYKSVDEILVNVIDNMSSNCLVTIYLDGEIYNGDNVKLGKHSLMVKAIDDNNNETIKELYFIVSDKTLLENIINGNIKLNNFIYIGIVSFISIVIIVLNIVISKKDKNKRR